MTAKTNATRQAELKARRKAAGFIRSEYYATVKEHEKLKALLIKDRASENS